MYDGVLTKVPGVKIFGFTDDVILEVYGESIPEVELTAAHAVITVSEWMSARGLELAQHKTEVVIVNNRKSVQHAVIQVGEVAITPKRSLKILGLTFGSHVDYVCKIALTAVAALSRRMSNSSKVCASRRRLLAGVAVS